MVAIWEYRIVLPFTVEEYKIAQLYMVAKYSASESNADNGDGVEVLKNEPYEDEDRIRGQYTHKLYHLASKLPSWLVSLMPKKALTLEEEAWNAYPNCTTILRCPFFGKFRLILKTTHQPDRGTSENALGLDPKTLKKRQVEFIDIAADPVESYVEDEDPAKFRSKRTGRGPLTEGWTKKCEPVMCAYKCVTVDVPYWGFGSQIEKYISKNAQRKILLDGHRKCFCWLDEWHGLAMEDIRRMELETEEAMARVRQIALRRVAAGEEVEPDPEADSGVLQDMLAEESDLTAAGATIQENEPLTPKNDSNKNKGGSGTPLSRSTTPKKSGATASPTLLRRPSLVGPSVAVGIATLSASDFEDFNLGGTRSAASPMPHEHELDLAHAQSLPQTPFPAGFGFGLEMVRGIERDLERDQHPAESEQLMVRTGSCESFNSDTFRDGSRRGGEEEDTSPSEENPDLAQYCVDVLDRAIIWTKQRAQTSPNTRGGGGGHKASGKITPLRPDNKSRGTAHDEGFDQSGGPKDVEHCVGVLSNALSVVRKRPPRGTR